MRETAAAVPFVEPDLACVADATRLCPARVRIASLYSESVDPTVANTLQAGMDGIKMTAKLAEHAAQARLRGCEIIEDDGSCPPWIAMTSSVSRQTTISGIRKALTFFK